MPGQLQLCLQLTFILDAGFKGLMEQSGKQTHICGCLQCTHSRSERRYGLCCSSASVAELGCWQGTCRPGHASWNLGGLHTSLRLPWRESLLMYNSVTVSRQQGYFGLCPQLHCEEWHKGRPWGCRKRDTISLVVLSQDHQTHLGGMCTADNSNKVCFGHMFPGSIWVISAFSFHMQWPALACCQKKFQATSL